MNILDTKLTDEQKDIFNECKKSLKKHGQAAILLSMGGGKSFIAAKLVQELKKNNHNFRIIWITTLSDLDKAKHLMQDTYFSESIDYVTFPKLQRDNNYADILEKEHKKYDLIVIDEAHHALATQTYKGVKYLLDKFSSAKLLVMTATKRRYSDRKHIFEWLTPKLTLGVDYNDRGLKYAIDNKLTCDFVYKSCNIQLLKDYCNIIKMLQQYSNVYKEFDDIIEKSQQIITDYSNNTFKKLGEYIQQDLEFDGSEGDRWFVFYHWIDELKESKYDIEKMFKIAYNNDNIKINIIEYHSEVSDKNVIDKIICEPTPNQVDVILTCNKGSESLHPKNTRGIVMLRKTLSGTVFEQQIGRALEIKEMCSYVKYIYDCVDNKANIEKSESIYNGTDTPDERRIASAFKNATKSNDVLDILNKKYGDTFDVEIMDSDIEELLNSFNNIKELFEDLSLAEKINEIFILSKGEDYRNIMLNGYFMPKTLLNEFDKQHGTKFSSAFLNIQNKFICGAFGEHYCDDEHANDAYFKLYDMFGDVLYITPGCTGESGYTIKDLINVANSVRKYNFDYRNSISHTAELKNKIADLRMLNLKNKLSESFQKFCKRNKIDINGIYSNLITEVLKSEDAKNNEKIVSSFKSLVRTMNSVKEIVDKLSSSEIRELDIDDKNRIIDAIAKEHIFTIKYYLNSYGRQASTAINITYKKILHNTKILINKEDYVRASKIIKSIIRTRLFSSEDTKSFLSAISKDDEYPIIDLVKRNESNDISLYEMYVLENLDVRVIDNSHKDANIRKLIDQTPFGITYNEFMNTSSIETYNKLQSYKIEGLPEYAQKMLKTRAYKANINQVESTKLMQKESDTVKEAVSELLYFDDDNINIIKNAIDNKEIDGRKLIKYAIPSKLYRQNSNYFDKALITPWNMLDNTITSRIKCVLSNNAFGYDDIIENLLKANLIPDEQIELANSLISIARG